MLACSAPTPAAASSCLPSQRPPRCLQPEAAPRGRQRLSRWARSSRLLSSGLLFLCCSGFLLTLGERLRLPGGLLEELATAPPAAPVGYCSAGIPAETVAPTSAMGPGEQHDALRLHASPHSRTCCTPESQHRQHHLASGMRQGPEIILGKPHPGCSCGSDLQVRLQGGDSQKNHRGNISSSHRLVTQPAGTDQGTEG